MDAESLKALQAPLKQQYRDDPDRALVTLKAMHLAMDGERFNLGAGMQANAEILLGTRTVMEYLLSPVRKAWHEAGRER